jgi:serine phosphatase RsbU (regulator of sigma subunit)
MPPATVLLSSPPDSTGDELRKLISAAGFVVADHLLGSAPAVDFGPVVAAVVEVGGGPGPAPVTDWAGVAAAQLRRWRAELGDQFVPVLWVAPADRTADKVVAGLDAGADVVLARPVEPAALVAQVRALARAHATAARVAARASESRLLGDQLGKALAQLEREQDMARRVRATFVPQRYPQVSGVQFHACYRPRNRTGGDFHDVRRLDEDHVGFFVGDVVGTGAAAGGLLGVFAQQSVVMKEIADRSYRIVPPDEVLTAVNRQLLGLGADDLPLVAMLAGVLDVRTGGVVLARAGLPAAVHVPATGTPGVWAVPGPFLGTADITYPPLSGTLALGDRLLIGTDGTRPDGDPGPIGSDRLLDAAAKHRTLGGAAFVDAVARELLQHVRHADDFTLLGIELG